MIDLAILTAGLENLMRIVSQTRSNKFFCIAMICEPGSRIASNGVDESERRRWIEVPMILCYN